MPKNFRGSLVGESYRNDSRTKFKGKGVSSVARRATVVALPPTGSDGEFKTIQVKDAGVAIRAVCYRIYFEETVGNSAFGTNIYPRPNSEEEHIYLQTKYPDDKEEQEHQRRQMLLASTKTGFYIVGQDNGEWPKIGTEVLAVPRLTGVLSETFFISPTTIKQTLNETTGLPFSKVSENFRNAPGQEYFFEENGTPVPQDFGRGTIKLANGSVNYAGLDIELKQKLEELASEGYDIVVTSAKRSTGQNNSIAGSAPTSAHLSGLAVDIKVRDTEFAESNGQSWALTEAGKNFVNIAEGYGLTAINNINHGSGPHIHLELPRQTAGQSHNHAPTNGFSTSEETGQ